MPQRIPEEELHAIEAVVAAHPNGIGVQDIEDGLEEEIARRTLQYRLKHLVDEGRLVKEGKNRWVKYRIPAALTERESAAEEESVAQVPVSKHAAEIRKYVRKHLPPETSRRFA